MVGPLDSEAGQPGTDPAGRRRGGGRGPRRGGELRLRRLRGRRALRSRRPTARRGSIR
ncbi:GTP pyrophosphokinase [Carbonactinospora thermoautotrophica]|uniref:GTP pyrophosphokinase n=1 Tax=Carbonactinospora thermoautotrophica TaxID=1469144 RepID=A0A132MS43_9ACTN|nr:GTP pyrophosphokinase [Carbonactinospora thermoautotrophica]